MATSTPARTPASDDPIWLRPGGEAKTMTRTDTPTGRVRQEGGIVRRHWLRLGLLSKIVVFLAAILVPLAAITWYVSVREIEWKMTDEFTDKGTAIAKSLEKSGVDLILTRDASTVQSLVDQFAEIGGVAYVMVYDRDRTMIAHSF